MARRRKAKDIEAEIIEQEGTAEPDASGVVAEASGNGIGHNSPPPDLTDADLEALAFQHKKSYSAALATKKAADAALKNVCKLAKAELGADAVDTIKDMIALETEEGEAKLKAKIERQLRAARWMAVPLGNQAELFGDVIDRTPAIERARAEGRRVGMEGGDKKPPYDQTVPQHDAWMAGWDDGQASIIRVQKLRDDAVFDAGDSDGGDPPPLGEAEPTHVSH